MARVRLANSLAQLKIDAVNTDRGLWCYHWEIDPNDWHPNDERALLDGCYFDMRAANHISQFYEDFLTVPHEGRFVPFILWDW